MVTTVLRRFVSGHSRRRVAALSVAVVTAALGVQIVAMAPAFANAANPNPTTTGTAKVNADGTVTANLSGTWSWPGQNCAGRYGEGYAVDWWGISSSPTPANAFSLTDATQVTAPGVTTTGTVSPVGAVPIQGGTYFHVGQYYAGETVNSASTCTDSGSGGSATSSGSWAATATYPSLADIPAQVCVNMYDEHGQEGKPSNSSNDFSPSQDNDNSIQTNHFDPSAGMGYCVALQVLQTISGHIYSCPGGSPSTTEVSGGTLTVTAGPKTIPTQPNPIAATNVPAGSYTMTATAPSRYHFVACNGRPATPTRTVVVPSGGKGVGLFYVALPAPTQTIQAEIYKCVGGAPSTTLASGGSITVPSAGLSSANPLTATKVAAGTYTVNATAASGQKFVTCGQSGVTVNGGSASQSVKVPSGGAGNGRFYVSAVQYGYLEVCQSSANGVTGSYSFTVNGVTFSVPAGACSAAMKEPAGTVTVVQHKRTGYTLIQVTTQPSTRLVSVDLPGSSAKVTVVPGNVSTQTIVTFVDKPLPPAKGSLKVCQVAGSGLAQGTLISFSNSSSSQTVKVPAGPPPGGYCVLLSGTFSGQVTVTQHTPTGHHVTAISVGPAGRLVGFNLAKGTVTVLIGTGVTEVTYTDS